jgi:hypothetical protein
MSITLKEIANLAVGDRITFANGTIRVVTGTPFLSDVEFYRMKNDQVIRVERPIYESVPFWTDSKK